VTRSCPGDVIGFASSIAAAGRPQINKLAYDEGVVIITCSSCGTRHLIADNRGLMDDADFGKGNLEQYLATQGRTDLTRAAVGTAAGAAPQLEGAAARDYEVQVDADGTVQVVKRASTAAAAAAAGAEAGAAAGAAAAVGAGEQGEQREGEPQ
jgi:DNL zinc finger